MYAQVEKQKDNNKSRAIANSVIQKRSDMKQGFGFVDNRLEAVAQKKMQDLTHNSYPPILLKSMQKKVDDYTLDQGKVALNTFPVQRLIIKESNHRGYTSQRANEMNQEKYREALALFSGSGNISQINEINTDNFLVSQVYNSQKELDNFKEQNETPREEWKEWGKENLGKGKSQVELEASKELFDKSGLIALRRNITDQLGNNEDAFVYENYEDLKYAMDEKQPVHLLSVRDMVENGNVPTQQTQGAFEQANPHQSCVIEALSEWNINVPGSNPASSSLNSWYKYFVDSGKDFRTDVDYGTVLIGTLNWIMVSNTAVSWNNFLATAENGNYLAGSYNGLPQGGAIGHMIGFTISNRAMQGTLIDKQNIAAAPNQRWLKYIFRE